jgi:phage antirepressor YoqD-like protein
MKTGLALTGAKPAAMTSLEIAELTDKQHAHVLRDIRIMLIELYGQEALDEMIPEKHRHRTAEVVREKLEAVFSSIFEDDPKLDHLDERGFSWERDARGYIAMFRLDKNHTMTLVSGYSAMVRMRTQKRLDELEEQVRNPPAPVFTMPKDFSEALRQLADKNDEVIKIGFEKAAVESELEAAAPKVEAYDYLHDVVEGSMTISNAAKALQLHRNFLFEWLSKNGWTFRFGGVGEWVGYQTHIDAGWLQQVTKQLAAVPSIRGAKLIVRCEITPRGLAELAKIFSADKKRDDQSSQQWLIN